MSDERETTHMPCDCVPDLGPVHCHLCSAEQGHEVSWPECSHALAEVGLTEKNTEKGNTMEHCDFCETTVESVSTGGGVGICADCRGEAEVAR